MAEREGEGESDPARPALRRAIRHRIRDVPRPFRVAAENFLAAETRMDLLGVGEEGELISVRIAARGDDGLCLSRALSDLAWLGDRRADLAKLVPDLGIESSARPRGLLLCPEFSMETRLAAAALPSGWIELVRYRCQRRHGRLEAVLDLDGAGAPKAARASTSLAPRVDPASGAPRARPAAPCGPQDDAPAPGSKEVGPAADAAPSAGFRTGLSDGDLQPEARPPVSLKSP